VGSIHLKAQRVSPKGISHFVILEYFYMAGTLLQNGEISSSHGGEYEDGCLLVCCAV
jgi:hypothetical protein